MAGGKQDTRQKMINMMYLVFIAMLALNISKEVLATLGLINDDIAVSTNDFKTDSNKKYSTLSSNSNNGYYKIAAEYMPQIQKIVDEYDDYIRGLKQQLINADETAYRREREIKSTGEKDTIIDYQIMDKSQDLDTLFFDGKEYTTSGQDFVNRFSSFPLEIESILEKFVAADLEKDPPTEEKEYGEFIDFNFSSNLDELNKRFNYHEKVLNRDGQEQPYLDYHFKGFPLIASISKLTKIQSDIRYVENKILEYTLSIINEQQGAISANTYLTLIDSEKSSFYTGDLVDASVVAGKKDSNFKPDGAKLFLNNRQLVKDIDFVITPGGIKLDKKLYVAGEYDLTGELFFERNNKQESIPVSHVIKIIDKPNKAVISNENMKSLYVGLDNPLNISMSGVSQDNISVIPENGTINKVNGVWNAKPTGQPGEYMFLTVRGQLDGQLITTNKQRFKIKNLPPAESVLVSGEDTYFSNDIITKFSLSRAKIAVDFKDFDYEVKARVTNFKVEISGRSTIELNTSSIDSNRQLISYIDGARTGESVRFFDIQVVAVTEAGQMVPAPKSSEFTLKIR